MKPCNREGEILKSLRSGRFDPEQRAHAAGCAACTDLIDVAAAVLDDRRALMRDAQLPGSGLVWWRATMRARQEAARTAMRTARFVQAVLVMVAVAGGLVLIDPKNAAMDVTAILTSMSRFAVPIFAFVALLILAPVAVYFVVTEE